MIEPFVCHGCSTTRKSFERRCEACGVERPKGGWPLHPHIGDLVADRYRILSALGRGSSGDVYLARDSRLHADAGDVVIKLFANSLLPDSPGASNLERRFRNEVRAARKVDNRHCVAVFDAGMHRGSPFLVMERVRGENLRVWQRTHEKLALPKILELFEQVAEALASVHAEGIVHRDIKPENLMIVREEPLFVKVLDFGLAHLADDGATFSGVGTPRYMAPEQILHEPIDARTDIYALGVTIYELLAGAPPFKGESIGEVLRAKQEREATPLLEVAPSTPKHIARLVDAMTRRSPDARPKNMSEVLLMLRRPATEPRGTLRTLVALTSVAAAIASLALMPWLRHSEDAPTVADDAVSTTAAPDTFRALGVAASTETPKFEEKSPPRDGEREAAAIERASLSDAGLSSGRAAAFTPQATRGAPRPIAAAEVPSSTNTVSSNRAAAPSPTFRSGGLKAGEL